MDWLLSICRVKDIAHTLASSNFWFVCLLYVEFWCNNPIFCVSLFLVKIEAVTRRILRITSTDGTAKVLVFSSWNDVLDVLEHSLAANNISFVRMKGGR